MIAVVVVLSRMERAWFHSRGDFLDFVQSRFAASMVQNGLVIVHGT